MILAGPFQLQYFILFYSKNRFINTSKVRRIARALCYIESVDTLYYQNDKIASHSDNAGQQQFRGLLLECTTRHKFHFFCIPLSWFPQAVPEGSEASALADARAGSLLKATLIAVPNNISDDS